MNLIKLKIKFSGEPEFSCDTCGKKYFFRSKLLDHQSVHRVLEFKCEYCPRSFRQETKLKAHYKVVHFKEKRTYRCEICNSTFTRRTTLRDHVLRQHPGLNEGYKNELIARILQMLPEELTAGSN
jgi:KRAB domain-containing zinc finger protein